MAETAPASSGSTGSPFWGFSLGFYRQQGVAEACIELQEAAGADVNLLLFLLWHGAQQRRLSDAEVEWLEQRIAPWRDRAVVPLRAIRRALKPPPGLAEPAAAEGFPPKIKPVTAQRASPQPAARY